jgi:hypothetical protein
VTSYRPGEGVLVDMEITPVTSVSGQASAVLRGSLANLPVPDRHYSADACFVRYMHETVYILFAQVRLDKSDLRNLLIVKMTPASVRVYLDSLLKSDSQSIESIADALSIEVEELPEFSTEPKESITLNASIIMAGVSGREGCLDFYYASPFSKGAVAVHKKLALDPVVRVDIRTSLLIGLNHVLTRLLKDLPDSVVNEVSHIKVEAGDE